MSACEKFIENLKVRLPDVCEVQDLIQYGIFKSRQAAESHRSTRDGPSFFKLGRRVIYPKQAVLDWLEVNKYVCKETAGAYPTEEE